MNLHEIRNLDEARLLLAQSLCLQRATAADPGTVRLALEWARELLSRGHPLPPLGFVADVGQVALGLDWENRTGRPRLNVPGVEPHLLASYEDHVLGKIYSDWTFSSAGEALRRYREGRGRARGVAFLLEQLRVRAGFAGVQFSPGVLVALLNEPPEKILQQGMESLRTAGLHDTLAFLYESLITALRGQAEVLGQEDLLELQSGTALAADSDRLAFRQVAEAAMRLERSLPSHRVRPLPRRQEVPTRILDEDTYPVGGFASLSNRGTVESLLHSQLAYIEEQEKPDLFEIKYLRDELLYYSRDENQFLRRRRTFVFAFYPDLIERIRFKDADTPFQRGVLLLALLFVVVRKLSEWLSTEALVFHVAFVVPRRPKWVFELQTEYELLVRLLREQAANGSVVFDFLLPARGSRAEAEPGGLDELKRRLRETLPRGKTEMTHGAAENAVQELCAALARRSLCQCLALSTWPRQLEAPDVVFTPFLMDGPAPAVGSAQEVAPAAEGNDALESWGAALRQVLERWI